MPSLLIFLTVIIAVTVPKNADGTVTVPDIDIAKLLDLVQQQRSRHISSESTDSSDSDDSDSEDIHYVRNGRVGENDIVDLIRQVIKSRSDKGNHDQKNNKDNPRNVARVKDRANNKNDHPQNDDISQVINQLLGSSFRKPEVKWHPSNKAPKKRVLPNRLLWDTRDINVDGNGLDEYSKIFVILNPQAVQKSKNNKSPVNQLISKILALSSPPSNRVNARPPKPKRYKGFALKDRIARRRGSREMYAPDDDMDDRPMKRGRNNGGNSGGHTAIPYIRHRGENIYEKDN